MRTDRRRELLLLEAEHQHLKAERLRHQLRTLPSYPDRIPLQVAPFPSPVSPPPVSPPPLVAVSREELLPSEETPPPAEEQLLSLLGGPLSTPPSPRSSPS